MSWRLLIATLLVALGAAAWGGIQLGDWLVAHAPQAAPAPGQEGDASQQPVLDANGRSYVAQPPSRASTARWACRTNPPAATGR